MSESSATNPMKQAMNLLGDVGGFVTILVAYLLALSGRSPGPYPQITAVITVLVTTAVLCTWRCRHIFRQAPVTVSPTVAGDLPSTAPQMRGLRDRLIDPFRAHSVCPYTMPVVRRRTELMALLVLGLGSVAWSGYKLPDAIPELTSGVSPTALLRNCVPARSSGALRVVVADFAEPAPQFASEIENRLFDSLTEGTANDRQICRMQQVVATRNEAQEVGRQAQAAILVWGRSDAVFDVHLEVMTQELQDLDLPPLPSEEVANFDFQTREPLRLSFLTDYLVSQILYFNGQPGEARQLLGNSLARAEQLGLVAGNEADMAKAYFMLGFLFDDEISAEPDLQQALDFYSWAVVLNPDLHAAVLNRGIVNSKLGLSEQAKADYTYLIDRQSHLASSAAVNRAGLQTTRQAAEDDLALAIKLDPQEGYWFRGNARLYLWNDVAGALADYREAVRLKPDDFFYRHSLGQAELIAGQAEAARQTYQQLLPLLSADSRKQVVGELRALIEARPEVAGNATAIIQLLSTAPLR